MSTIGPPSELIAYLRGHLDLVTTTAAAPVQRDQASHRYSSNLSSPVRRDRSDALTVLISRRMQAIGRADPDRRRKAFRSFLELTLLHELGETMINDATFQDLVSQVLAHMERRDDLKSMMDSAADDLLSRN